MGKIIVIVPVFNTELYLGMCVKSILKQTYENFELVLVDDGSTDGCYNLCEKFSKEDSRVKTIHKKNGGPSSARNAGIDYALLQTDCEYICFVDSDDFVEKYFLAFLFNNINDSELCSCGCTKILSETTNKNVNYKVHDLNEVNYWISSLKYAVTESVCGKLYKKSVFNRIRFPLGKFYEDSYIIHHIIGECNRIKYIEIPLYHYRDREGSTMNKTNINNSNYKIELMNIYIDRTDYFYKKAIYSLFEKYYVRAVDILMSVYIFNKRKIITQYYILKKWHYLRRKQYHKATIKQCIFFRFPFMYSFLRKLFKKNVN